MDGTLATVPAEELEPIELKPILRELPAHVPPLLKGGALFIDNSNYENIMECKRKGLYRIVHQRQFRGKASALNFGGAVHASLDVRYKRGGPAFDSVQQQLDAGFSHLHAHPVELGDWRTPQLLQEVIMGYSRTYPFDDFQLCTLDEGAPLVELPFAIPMGEVDLAEPILLPSLELAEPAGLLDQALARTGRVEIREFRSIPIVWTGKIDLVINRGGKIWLADHKTTSVFGPSYYEQYGLSSQFSGYAWAIQQALNTTVEGVLINVLAIRKPTKTGKGVEFDRKYLPIEQYIVNEFHLNTLNVLSDFLNGFVHGRFNMETTSCRNKWQKNCEYKGVCTMEPQSRLLYLHSGDYETAHWSPLHNDE
jgi:hypothetical protein